MRKGIAGLLLAGILPKLIFLIVIIVLVWLGLNYFPIICMLFGETMDRMGLPPGSCFWAPFAIITLFVLIKLFH